MKKYSKQRAGFTIVEIITVLFIVSVGLIGVLSLIIKNIQSQTYNKYNLIAYQLAQEGVELIREVRDTNWLNGRDFNYSLANGSYYLDYANQAPVNATSPEPLFITPEGYYIHGGVGSGVDSGFRRLITVENVSNHSIKVVSSASWAIKNRSYSYDLETILYDWR
jgi:Tfp pilus assembly protein PilV